MKDQLKTDICGINVWPYASVMLDESSSSSIARNVFWSRLLVLRFTQFQWFIGLGLHLYLGLVHTLEIFCDLKHFAVSELTSPQVDKSAS